MTRDILFLLPPAFEDNGQTEMCLESMTVAGILASFPDVAETIETRYQPIAKPRPDMTAMIGLENQNCPTLVLAEGADPGPHAAVKTSKGVRFLDNARDIAKYLAHRHATPFPRS